MKCSSASVAQRESSRCRSNTPLHLPDSPLPRFPYRLLFARLQSASWARFFPFHLSTSFFPIFSPVIPDPPPRAEQAVIPTPGPLGNAFCFCPRQLQPASALFSPVGFVPAHCLSTRLSAISGLLFPSKVARRFDFFLAVCTHHYPSVCGGLVEGTRSL